jgi:hypothetical protein
MATLTALLGLKALIPGLPGYRPPLRPKGERGERLPPGAFPSPGCPPAGATGSARASPAARPAAAPPARVPAARGEPRSAPPAAPPADMPGRCSPRPPAGHPRTRRRASPDLSLVPVGHAGRAAHQPVAQPLIRHVGAHPVIGRRGDHPREGTAQRLEIQRPRIPAGHPAGDRRRQIPQHLRDLAGEQLQGIHLRGAQPAGLPEAHRIIRLGGISPRHPVGEIGRRPLPQRAVQAP